MKVSCAEGHIVAQIFISFPSLTMVVRALWAEVLDGVVELDVGEFFAVDDALLRFGGEGIPGVEIVER